MTTEIIEAPMPGVFYRRPSPDEDSYVEEGESVAAGTVVGLVGVMKNFHEIKADRDGVVTRFMVENEQEISAGDELLELEVD